MAEANPHAPKSAALLLEQAVQLELVEAGQGEELRRAAPGRAAAQLGQDLVRRGWLTAFQAQELVQGRGPGLIFGQYCLLEPLGGGGMGQVFKARHRLMRRVVALKVIRADLLDRPEAVQ